MGPTFTWIAGASIVAGATWLIRYATSIRRGYRHHPGSKSVWWIPGGGTHGMGQVPPLIAHSSREDEIR
jgi:hypothetical protein